jgi:hypothetical protein
MPKYKDQKVNDIVSDVAKDLGFTERQVRAVLTHTLNWTRHSMAQGEYTAYLYPKFVVFRHFNHPIRGKYFPNSDVYYNNTHRFSEKNKLRYVSENITEEKLDIVNTIKRYYNRVPEDFDIDEKYTYYCRKRKALYFNMRTLMDFEIDDLKKLLEKLINIKNKQTNGVRKDTEEKEN